MIVLINNLGENLKRLRRERDLTQEDLAEILKVSPQSISRWETNMGYPDIELLPAIANYYGVTIDYLLGFDLNLKQTRIKEICDQIMSLKTKGERREAIQIARTALKEFPNEYQIMYLLASCLFNFGKDEVEKKIHNQEVIDLCEHILKGCVDDSLRSSVSLLLSYTYYRLGKVDQALELANKMPSYYSTSNEVLKTILNGPQKKLHVQGNLLTLLQIIYRNLEELLVLSTDFEEKVRILNAWIKIFACFFDQGDYYFFHALIGPVYRYLAALYADQNRKEETLKFLAMASEHAIQFDTRPSNYTYTSTLLSGFKDQIANSVTDSTSNQSWILLNKMEDERYDFIRSDEKFIKIINDLQLVAKC